MRELRGAAGRAVLDRRRSSLLRAALADAICRSAPYRTFLRRGARSIARCCAIIAERRRAAAAERAPTSCRCCSRRATRRAAPMTDDELRDELITMLARRPRDDRDGAGVDVRADPAPARGRRAPGRELRWRAAARSHADAGAHAVPRRGDQGDAAPAADHPDGRCAADAADDRSPATSSPRARTCSPCIYLAHRRAGRLSRAGALPSRALPRRQGRSRTRGCRSAAASVAASAWRSRCTR